MLDNGYNILLYGIYVAVTVISESLIAELKITLSVACKVVFKVKVIVILF
jgi:magnesium-transporting ATPase (P-type)